MGPIFKMRSHFLNGVLFQIGIILQILPKFFKRKSKFWFYYRYIWTHNFIGAWYRTTLNSARKTKSVAKHIFFKFIRFFFSLLKTIRNNTFKILPWKFEKRNPQKYCLKYCLLNYFERKKNTDIYCAVSHYSSKFGNKKL